MGCSKATKAVADLAADDLCATDLLAGIDCETTRKTPNPQAASRRLNPIGRWSTALPKTALAAALLRALARRERAP
jgi:hypothetical protein